WKAYYVLLQIAFILVQLLERGSLLRRLAAEAGRPVWKLFGSLRNVARRLLDSVRYLSWEEAWFDPGQAAQVRVGPGSPLAAAWTALRPGRGASAGRVRELLRELFGSSPRAARAVRGARRVAANPALSCRPAASPTNGDGYSSRLPRRFGP